MNANDNDFSMSDILSLYERNEPLPCRVLDNSLCHMDNVIYGNNPTLVDSFDDQVDFLSETNLCLSSVGTYGLNENTLSYERDDPLVEDNIDLLSYLRNLMMIIFMIMVLIMTSFMILSL